jgi:hypothetical protein
MAVALELVEETAIASLSTHHRILLVHSFTPSIICASWSEAKVPFFWEGSATLENLQRFSNVSCYFSKVSSRFSTVFKRFPTFSNANLRVCCENLSCPPCLTGKTGQQGVVKTHLSHY